MAPFIEFEGKNVEQAVTRACNVLNIPRDQLKHDVLCFGATGIFGLVGIKKARIRVAAPGAQDADIAAPAAGISPLDVAVNPLPLTNDLLNSHDPVIPAPLKQESEAFLVLEHGQKSFRPALNGQADCSQVTETDVEDQTQQPLMHEDIAALGRLALQQLVDSVTCGAEIAVSCNSRQLVYTISGGDTAALIGKRGQTLEAIQYLLKKIVNKSAEDRIRIVVNIAGLAAKRRNDLQMLASRFAEKACLNGKSVTIGRFNPQDRKSIHLALKNDRRVKTQSKGEGYMKKLVVIPRLDEIHPGIPFSEERIFFETSD